tara:strand:- start:136 stop:618 length:483 start_codon:yes stop_codon:yes gene_type:complete
MVNRFLLFDALTFEFNELKITKNNDCVVCGENPSVTKLIDYKQFCGIELVNEKVAFTELDATELQKKLENGSSPIIIDVREDFELEISKIEGSLHIPMNQIPNRINELNPENDYVIMCRTGVRSSQICEFLSNQNFRSIANLSGGINEWAKKIDSSLPVY